MTVSTDIVGNAINWLDANRSNSSMLAADWRKVRNQFLKDEGVGGVVKNGKNSKSFPPWWGMDTEFWFESPEKEKDFVDKWK